MKKIALLAICCMASISSFAWSGNFTTSCGVTVYADSGTDSLTKTASYLKNLNGRLCGTSNVRIIFF